MHRFVDVCGKGREPGMLSPYLIYHGVLQRSNEKKYEHKKDVTGWRKYDIMRNSTDVYRLHSSFALNRGGCNGWDV